jgi:hypothetical protein
VAKRKLAGDADRRKMALWLIENDLANTVVDQLNRRKGGRQAFLDILWEEMRSRRWRRNRRANQRRQKAPELIRRLFLGRWVGSRGR